MIAHAQTAVLLATAQKFDDRGLTVVAPLDDVDIAYVTDAVHGGDPNARGARRLAASGVSRGPGADAPRPRPAAHLPPLQRARAPRRRTTTRSGRAR